VSQEESGPRRGFYFLTSEIFRVKAKESFQLLINKVIPKRGLVTELYLFNNNFCLLSTNSVLGL